MKERACLLLIILLAFAIRIIFANYFFNFGDNLSSAGNTVFIDGYREIAANILAGNGYSHTIDNEIIPAIDRPPIYTLITLFSLLVNENGYGIVILNAFFASFAVLFSFLLAQQICLAPMYRLIVAAAVAIWPISIWQSRLSLPENLLYFLVPLTVLVLLKNKTLWKSLLAGILCGLLALTHSAYLSILPIGLLSISMIKTSDSIFKLKMTLCITIGMITAITPWMLRTNSITGKLQISAGFGHHYLKGKKFGEELSNPRLYFTDIDQKIADYLTSKFELKNNISSLVSRNSVEVNQKLDNIALSKIKSLSLTENFNNIAMKTILFWIQQQNFKHAIVTAVIVLPLLAICILCLFFKPSQEVFLIFLFILSVNLAFAFVFIEGRPLRYSLSLMPLVFILSGKYLSSTKNV